MLASHDFIHRGQIRAVARLRIMDMNQSRPRHPYLGLLVALVACFAVAGLGGWATASSVGSWYATLAKPAFNPPNWVFSPVWTLLYAMMAVAAWRVWRLDGRLGSLPLGMFALQLALNLAWSVLFFGLRAPLAALIDVLALLVAIAATLALFMRRDRVAGWLMVPYLAWVMFASVLNLAIVQLN